MKIIFFGSDDFAVCHLKELIKSKHQIQAVVTQPDKPKGRSYKSTPTLVKELALKEKCPVYDPPNLQGKDVVSLLKECDADLFVVVAYGNILPADILNIPSLFCVNVHASLLPRYRGAAPINWAIINGEDKTGVTIFRLNESPDAGEIIAQKEMPILETDTSISLRSKLASLGSNFLIETLSQVEKGGYSVAKQNYAQASYAPKLKKTDGRINWSREARYLHNMIRGLLPWPAARCQFNGRQLKILASKVVQIDNQKYQPGEVTGFSPEGFVVAAGQQGLLVTYVHLESSKAMDARRFLAGHPLDVGFQLD